MNGKKAREQRQLHPIEHQIASPRQTELVAQDQSRFLHDPQLRFIMRPYRRGEIGRPIDHETAAWYEAAQAHPQEWAMLIVWVSAAVGTARIPIPRGESRQAFDHFAATYRHQSVRWRGAWDLGGGEASA